MTRPRLVLVLVCCLVPIVGLGAEPDHRACLAQLVAGDVDPIRIHRRERSTRVQQYWASLPEARPPLRGFRAPILDDAGRAWPFHWPGDDAPPEVRSAADLVAAGFARDGLTATLASVIRVLGPSRFDPPDDAAMTELKAVGVPVDLLAFFAVPGAEEANARSVASFVAGTLKDGLEPGELAARLAILEYRFTPSLPGFRVATESGEHDLGLLRLQMTRATDWQGVGDGGSVDVARQLMQRLPDVPFIISIEERFAAPFASLAGTWTAGRRAPVTIIPEPLPVAQWAQDNGKPGFVWHRFSTGESALPAGGRPVSATLAPRFASRGDDGSTFVPGETFLLDGLASAGHRVMQSPLLFQGGNLIAVREPRTGRRILLIGEGEIHRNTALGLSREQATEAFRVEFGVDECRVLPAVSYHIDYEVTVRAHGDELVAFVNDSMAATRMVLRLGVGCLETAGVLDAAAAGSARQLLAAGRHGDFIATVAPRVLAQAREFGRFPESLARHFSAGPVDSGVGNLQRFLLAMDLLLVSTLGPDDVPPEPLAAGYLRAIARRDAERAALHERFRKWGWRVVPVPSMADGDRSINYLNGLHDRTRYVMPAYGGLFAPVDEAAARAFADTLGAEVEIVPILCGESQRRNGAVRCSVGAYPAAGT